MGMRCGVRICANGGLICQVAGGGIIGIVFLGVITVAIRASRRLGGGQPVEGIIGKGLRLGIAHLPVLDPLDVAHIIIVIFQVLQRGARCQADGSQAKVLLRIHRM